MRKSFKIGFLSLIMALALIGGADLHFNQVFATEGSETEVDEDISVPEFTLVTIKYVDQEGVEIKEPIVYEKPFNCTGIYRACNIGGYTLVGESEYTLNSYRVFDDVTFTFKYSKDAVKPLYGAITVEYKCDSTVLDTYVMDNVPIGYDVVLNALRFSGYTVKGPYEKTVKLDDLNPNIMVVYEYIKDSNSRSVSSENSNNNVNNSESSRSINSTIQYNPTKPDKLTESDKTVDASEILTVDNFTDIPSTHWGIETIKWGLENKMLTGYPNNLFKPDNIITESEFVVILTKYADNTNKENIVPLDVKHWSQPYYNELEQFRLPLDGYNNDVIKDSPITRGNVARVIAAKYGFNLEEQQAVYFLYENGLSQGRTRVMSYAGYAPNEYLTRTEIVQFFNNIENNGNKTMSFKGFQSIKGTANADTILGIEGVSMDYRSVNFSDFGSGLTTKVGTDGKVYIEMDKITTPISIPENKYDKVVNYIDFSNEETVDAALMNNSIVLYKDVELPASDGFKLGKNLLISDDGQRHGIVGLEIDGNGWKQTGSFTDKKVFIELLSNLQYFQASPNQIAKAKEVVESKYGVHNERDNTTTINYTSSIKNSTMRIIYGDGTVDIAIYNGTNVLKSGDSTVKID